MNNKFSFSAWLHKVLNIPYKLHVQVSGTDGPVVIFLHGLAASSESWSKLLPLISTRYRCITIDLLGFGQSPKPENSTYSLHEHVASVHRTIKSLKLDAAYILVGHSLGSLLAANYTKIYSYEVKELYMLSPPIYVSGNTPSKLHIRFRSGAYARAYSYFRSHRNFTLSGAKHLRKILRSSFFLLSEENWVPFERSLEQCIEKQDMLNDLEHLNTPTKIFYGLQDPLIIPGNIQALAKLDFITVQKVRAGHIINNRYAKAIAESFLN